MANFSIEDKHWLQGITPTQRPLDTVESALVTTTWETETDQDSVNITKTITTGKTVRKMCIIKLITLPIEFVLTAILFDTKKLSQLFTCGVLYFKFLVNKIKLKDFNKSLIAATKDSIII